jgi:hypothetical protein
VRRRGDREALGDGEGEGGAGIERCAAAASTTGIAFFAECLRHSANAILHSAKPLPSVTLGKEHSANISSAKGSLSSTFFGHSAKTFAECQKALGKEKHSAN